MINNLSAGNCLTCLSGTPCFFIRSESSKTGWALQCIGSGKFGGHTYQIAPSRTDLLAKIEELSKLQIPCACGEEHRDGPGWAAQGVISDVDDTHGKAHRPDKCYVFSWDEPNYHLDSAPRPANTI